MSNSILYKFILRVYFDAQISNYSKDKYYLSNIELEPLLKVNLDLLTIILYINIICRMVMPLNNLNGSNWMLATTNP